MVVTDFHSKYYAHLLTKRVAWEDPDKLGQSLLNATVDLNPHQIDAVLFAFRSPLSRGALLADEVGLGKVGAARAWGEGKTKSRACSR